MNRLFAALGRVVVRYRYLVVIAWIVLIVLTTRAFPSLSSEVNNDNNQFLPARAPSSVAASLAAPILGNPNTTSEVTVVAARSNGTLGGPDEAALSRELVLLRALPSVTSARILGVSPDRAAAEIVAMVHVNVADVTAQAEIIDKVVASFALARAPSDLALHVAGPIATNVANQQQSNSASERTQGFSFLFIVVLLVLIFRSFLAPVVTLLPSAFALLVSMRLIGALGAHGLQISEITELLLIVLLIGAGTDYGLFLVFRVREEVRGGLGPHEAVRHSLVQVGESISASAGTVIFALLSLMLASFGIYKDLGVPLAIGVAVMLAAGITLLPALLAIFGRAVFFPSRLVGGNVRDGAWGRVASRLVARPGITLATGIVVFGALAAAASGFKSGGFGGALGAPAGSDAAKGNALVARHFPHASTNPANLVFSYDEPVYRDPSVIARAERSLVASGTVDQLTSPLDPNGTRLSPATYARLYLVLGPPGALAPSAPAGSPDASVTPADYDAYRASAGFVSASGKVIQFEAAFHAGGQQGTAALHAVPAVRAAVDRAARASGAKQSGVAGEAAGIFDVSSTSNSDLVHIIPVAIVAIALLLALVLRSAVAPFYLILSVALSYFAALGVSTLVFIDVGGEGGLTFILPFLMFIFLLALGEDYNILVMTRIREEARRAPLRDAVVVAVGRSGPTITAAGLVLAGTFGVLAVVGGGGPGGEQIRDIGFGLAIGILMDTFLVRTLLVPSTVALLGRWNWWPARMGRRRKGVELAVPERPSVPGASGPHREVL